MKIRTGQELLDVIHRSKNTVVVGIGWIGKLTVCYLDKYGHIYLNCMEMKDIIEGKSGYSTFIIAQQEREGEEQARQLSDLNFGHVYYLGNNVKNEMDTVLMADSSDIYEREVLVHRKRELDDRMQYKFSAQIQKIIGMSEFPIFQEIEIETINRCNGTCSFCPINRLDDTRTLTKMKEELFESIIMQLAEMKFQGRVGLYSNNEPLLDKRIVSFAQFVWEKLPKACKILYTNGTLLDKDTFIKLMQYLDILCIDLYYDQKEEEVLTENVIEILSYGILHTDIQKKVMLQFINRNAIRNNRGGSSKNRKNTYQVKATCMLPYIQMVVRPDGKLSLCCNDALGRNTLGDLNCESLTEAWNNQNYQMVRKQIISGRQNMEFCQKCDNYASVNTKGNEEFSQAEMKESWKELQKRLGRSLNWQL